MADPTGGIAGAAAAGRRAQRLVRLAILATVLGFVHHVDHTVRANHIGWPVIDRVTPVPGDLKREEMDQASL